MAQKEKQEKLKITAIINTRNCEDILCNTLESIKDIDEIIALDEHSSDDTLEILKEYKVKTIYVDKISLSDGFKQALTEAKNEWIFLIKDNEIIPQKLLFEINNYIENPKKNKNSISLSSKTFYSDKEIKFLKEKKELRLFQKGFCELKNNYSFTLKLKQNKIHHINPNFKIKNAVILKYIKSDISSELINFLNEVKLNIKTENKKNVSVFIRPLLIFIKNYICKFAIFDGKIGFILSFKKTIEEFIKQVIKTEKEK